MTSHSADQPSPLPPAPQSPQLSLTPSRSPIPALAGFALCLLLVIAQIALGGYQLGVGNQAIQIAFLKHGADPTLFNHDEMVRRTFDLYPTYFFRALAPLLSFLSVDTLYLALQLLTAFLTLAAVYWLGRSIYRSHAAALAAVAILVAGHLRALAGDTLYSQGFTHTFAALPIAIAALALAYRHHWLWAFALAGALFNIHALTSAYTLLMLAAALLADIREGPLSKWLLRATLCGLLAAALALPTLFMLLSQHQTFDAQWLNLMRIRSADHSFPSTWWAANNPDVPRFILIFALFVLSWSFSPVRRPDSTRATRITILMTLAVLALFAVGYLFTELWPNPTIIRLQPFRASRLLMILMLVHIAHGAIAAIRAGVARKALSPEGFDLHLSTLEGILETAGGILILATLAIPALLPLLPLTVAAITLIALITGRISWRQGLVAAAAILISILGYLQIKFPLPFLSSSLLSHNPGGGADAQSLGWIALAAATLFAILFALFRQPLPRIGLYISTLATAIILAIGLVARESEETAPNPDLAGPANFARKTPKDTLFLTPTGFANFRIQSDRAIVGDWRDGTQLYFSADFGQEWFKRVLALEPALKLSDDRSRLLARGHSLADLSDEDLIKIARQFKAQYILLPAPAPPPVGHPRSLIVAYKDSKDPKFLVYEPRIPVAATAKAPPEALNPVEWAAMENFMATTVAQNIEKYRKADLTLRIVDPAGKPVQDLPLKLDQTRSPFTVGASLGFFEPTNIVAYDDERASNVRPVELEKLPEVFNGSMIPYSSKWTYIEPALGQYRWSELDKYVNYCAKNNLTVEFHHLTGTLPPWVEQLGGDGGQRGLNFGPVLPAVQIVFRKHCLAVVDRYADRIKYFQVVNEKFMMQYVPSVFKELKEKYPNNQFGLSDCTNFWSPSSYADSREQYEFKGFDAIAWLKKQGVQPDFFSMHGHHPVGLWADPREMYYVFDRIQREGVRVHVTEMFMQLGGPVQGPVRRGTWTPALQAEYLQRYFTVCFSHPAVDLVNLWGIAPDGFGGTSDSGLIDRNGRTRIAFDTLKKLFTETWRTHTTGRLELDGSFKTRAFHGDYTLTVTLPNGKTATTTLTLPQKPEAQIRLQLNPETGALQVVP